MQHTSSDPAPAGSLRGLLSRTLTRGRSTEHAPRRKQKSRPSSPTQNKQLGLAGPTVSPRSRSISWSGHGPKRKLSKDGKCWSTRRFSAKHPPPFAEAFRHSIIHAKLETPVPRGNVKRDKSATSSPAIGVDVHASPLVGRTSRSNSEGYELASKVFVLTDDGCMLQYQSDGASNRTPERILELGPQSISVASDAIPGKHWVLNIVSDGRHDTLRPNPTLKPVRSRLFLRQPSEAKRYARDLLVVFANDCTFNEWLICMRKEIEALGGLEYRPDSRGAGDLLQTGHMDNELDSLGIYSLPKRNHCTQAPSGDTDGTSIEVQKWKKRTVSHRSTAGSSSGSRNDLDRLRASIVDAQSLESGTGSSYAEGFQDPIIPDINVVRPDPVRVTESEPQAMTATRRKKNIAPILVLPPSVDRRSASWSPSLPSPHFPRTPTLATDTVHGMAGAFKKPVSPATPTSSFQPDQTPFSFMQSFQFTPYMGAPRSPTVSNTDEASQSSVRPSSRRSFSFASHSSQNQAEFDSFADDRRSTSIRDSMDDDIQCPDSPPPAYTLAPRRQSSLVFRQELKDEDPSADTLVGLGISGHLRTGSGLTSFVFPSRVRGPVSPPATNDTDLSRILDSPTEPPTKSFIPFDYSRDNNSDRIGRQKSMPNLVSTSGAPVAPPPSVPLPAIPQDALDLSGRQRSESQPSSPLAQQPWNNYVRSTTLEMPKSDTTSPLTSNPVSPAELKFARRLSAVQGFSPVDAKSSVVIPNRQASYRSRKRSTSKSPPPSTWEAWKSFPTLMPHPHTTLRESGSPRSTTPPPLVHAQVLTGNLVGTVGGAIEQRLLTRQRSMPDWDAGDSRGDYQNVEQLPEEDAKQFCNVGEAH